MYNPITAIYPDTDKELYFDTDYVFIRDQINSFKTCNMLSIIENLYKALENAGLYHSELLENALYMDIAAVKKQYFVRMISCSSSGTIAGYIGKTAYKSIDRAVNSTITYLCDIATDEDLFNLSTDPESFKKLVHDCYIANYYI